MKTILLSFLFGILETMGVPKTVKLPDSHPVIVRATSCADDVVEVCSLLPEYQRSVWCPVTFMMAMKEGNCYASPPGFNDQNRACGPLQIHNPELEIAGATCAKVRADRKLGLRVGMARMIRLSKECGSIGAGLTAYATYGACPQKGWVLHEIRKRLKLVGVDPATPWSPGARSELSN
jgi:hypothetical protein